MLRGVAPTTPQRLVIVRHDPDLLQSGQYHLGYSHQALWQLDLPPSTFRLTVLRDPVRRLVSYYRYLLWTRRESRHNPERLRRLEGSWRDLLIEAEAMGDVGQESIVTLAETAPPRHVSTQLWMFSQTLDPHEAARNVLTCHAIFRTETFGDNVRQLGARLNLPLRSCRERVYETASLPAPTPDELEHVRTILAPEYEMLAHVKRLQAV